MASFIRSIGTVFACLGCGLAVETLGAANSASLLNPRCTACGGELERVDDSDERASGPRDNCLRAVAAVDRDRPRRTPCIPSLARSSLSLGEV